MARLQAELATQPEAAIAEALWDSISEARGGDSVDAMIASRRDALVGALPQAIGDKVLQSAYSDIPRQKEIEAAAEAAS